MPCLVWQQRTRCDVGRVLNLEELTLRPGQSWQVTIDWQDSVSGNIDGAQVRAEGVSVSEIAFADQTVTFCVAVVRGPETEPGFIECEIADRQGHRHSCLFRLAISEALTHRVDTESSGVIAPKYIGVMSARALEDLSP